MNVCIRKLGFEDLKHFKELIHVFEDVFDMKEFEMPVDDHLQKMLEEDKFYVFVALLDNRVIGGLTAYRLQQYYTTSSYVYIYDLAVMKNYQRKGIGKELISGITDFARESGFDEVFVQADRVDDYALDFYRSTGAREEDVVHYYYTLDQG